MPSACAERDRFDLCGSLHPASPRFAPSLRFASLIFGAFSTRAIYLKFEICGLSIAAHAPKNVVRRTGRRRRSRSDAQAPARQIESVTSMHDIRQVRIPRRITRTARICCRACPHPRIHFVASFPDSFSAHASAALIDSNISSRSFGYQSEQPPNLPNTICFTAQNFLNSEGAASRKNPLRQSTQSK